MGRKKRVRIAQGDPVVKFMPLRGRRLMTIEVDLTKRPTKEIEKYRDMVPDFKGAVVKPVVTYFAGDEEVVRGLVDDLVERLAGWAKYVRRPEVRVIRDRKRRIEDVRGEMSPADAVREYIKARPPKGIKSARVVELMDGMFDGIHAEPPARGKDFHVKALAVEDFMPFGGKHSLKLGPGVYGVRGKYAGEVGSSNRAGKSALVQAIPFALYGKTIRKLRSDKMVHDDADALVASVVLSTSDGKYKVKRTVGKKSSLVVETPDGKKVRGVNKGQGVIDSLLGLTFKDFAKTCFVGQGDVDGLLGESSSSAIEDSLSRWLGLGVWDDVSKVVNAEHGRFARALAMEEDRLEVVRGELSSSEFPSKAEVAAAEREYKRVVEANMRVDMAPKQIAVYEEQLELARKAARSRKLASSVYKYQREKVEAERDLKKLTDKYDDARVRFRQSSEKIAELRVMLSTGFDGHCPVDGGVCPRRGVINDNRSAVRGKLEDARQSRDELKRQVAAFERKMAKARAAIERAKENLWRAEEASKLVKEATGQKSAAFLVKKIKALKKQHGERVDERPAMERFKELASARSERNKLIRERKELKAHIKRDRVAVKELAYLKVLASKRGVRSFQLEHAVRSLEAQANSVLDQVGAPHRIEFAFERELKEWSSVCYECGAAFPAGTKVRKCEACGSPREKAKSEGIQVNVVEGPAVREYEQDSGGGQTVLALAVRIALSRLLGARVLFLDEVCASLDQKNLESLVAMLKRLPDAGFEQVFVISHRREVADSMDRCIVVERLQDELRSTARVE